MKVLIYGIVVSTSFNTHYMNIRQRTLSNYIFQILILKIIYFTSFIIWDEPNGLYKRAESVEILGKKVDKKERKQFLQE